MFLIALVSLKWCRASVSELLEEYSRNKCAGASLKLLNGDPMPENILHLLVYMESTSQQVHVKKKCFGTIQNSPDCTSSSGV